MHISSSNRSHAVPRVNLSELQVFLTVAREHSFSRAAALLSRTQPGVSQAVKRLEGSLNERLLDRASKGARLTEAGKILVGYAERLERLTQEVHDAVRELQDLRLGHVLIGANEAAVHVLLPVIERFRDRHPEAQIEVIRRPSRQIGEEVLSRTLDFGVLTFSPRERGLHSLTLGEDELVMLMHTTHPFAKRRTVTMEELGRQTVIAHNDPSPARERVLRLYEEHHSRINIQIALPSLDGIKHPVEMGLGVALLPRRCALSEIASGRLRAANVPGLRLARHVRLIYRGSGEMSHAAEAFLKTARAVAGWRGTSKADVASEIHRTHESSAHNIRAPSSQRCQRRRTQRVLGRDLRGRDGSRLTRPWTRDLSRRTDGTARPLVLTASLGLLPAGHCWSSAPARSRIIRSANRLIIAVIAMNTAIAIELWNLLNRYSAMIGAGPPAVIPASW